jgi:hypothetical protein
MPAHQKAGRYNSDREGRTKYYASKGKKNAL